MRSVRPGNVDALAGIGYSNILSGAYPLLLLAGLGQEDIAVAPPRGNGLPRLKNQTSAIHRTGVQLPCAGSHLADRPESNTIKRRRHVQVARTVKHVTPHDGGLPVVVDGEGWRATFADRPGGRSVNHH